MGYFLVLIALLVSAPSFGKQSREFSIDTGMKEIVYTSEQLRARPDTVKIRIPLLNYPSQDIEVEAVPVDSLLKENELKPEAIVTFKCEDGFSGVLNQESLLQNEKGAAKAFLAIEPKSGWPPLPKSKDGKSAGPFYLIWTNPQASDIPPEYWPYQLSGFRFEADLNSLFPSIFPSKAKKHSRVHKGFIVYQKRCMPCHQMNKEGPGMMGPDLNVPMGPTEYFKEEALKQFLKNPQSVRNWPSMKMKWVKDNSLTKTEIDNVIAYLKHMSSNRRKSVK